MIGQRQLNLIKPHIRVNKHSRTMAAKCGVEKKVINRMDCVSVNLFAFNAVKRINWLPKNIFDKQRKTSAKTYDEQHQRQHQNIAQQPNKREQKRKKKQIISKLFSFCPIDFH